jgi:hypothetical protein
MAFIRFISRLFSGTTTQQKIKPVNEENKKGDQEMEYIRQANKISPHPVRIPVSTNVTNTNFIHEMEDRSDRGSTDTYEIIIHIQEFDKFKMNESIDEDVFLFLASN